MKARYFLPVVVLLLLAIMVYAQSQGPTPRPWENSDSQKKNPTNSDEYTHYQQRGTEELPLVVKTPTPKSKEEADYERYQRETKPAYEQWSVYITGFIAFITAVLAIFNVFLWMATKRAADAALKTADHLAKAERARIYDVKGFAQGPPTFSDEESKEFNVLVWVLNVGKTPAIITRLHAGAVIREPYPAKNDISKTSEIIPPGGFIVKGGETAKPISASVRITRKEWETHTGIRHGKIALLWKGGIQRYLWGRSRNWLLLGVEPPRIHRCFYVSNNTELNNCT